MKRFLGISAALLGMSLPLLAQVPASNSTVRLQAVQWQNGGYGQNRGWGNQRYSNVLAPEWQQKFDSYYQRWMNYRATNNQDQARSMEDRMYSIMDNYRIPRNVPFDAVASPGVAGNSGYGNGSYGNDGYYGRRNHDRDDRDHDRDDRDRDRDHDQDRDRRGGYYGNGASNGGYSNGGYNGAYGNNGNGYHNVLAPEWQQKFDSYYQRWMSYRATNNQDEMRSMEKRMQDIMVNYRIPANTPYSEVASPNVAYGR